MYILYNIFFEKSITNEVLLYENDRTWYKHKGETLLSNFLAYPKEDSHVNRTSFAG
jgi:hypothetical protein